MYAEFADWLAAKGIDPETVTPQMKPVLQAQWRAEQAPAPKPPEPAPKPADPAAGPSSFDERMRAIEEESARIEYIRTRTASEAERNVGNPAKLKQLREMCESAILDKKCDARAYDLALMRAGRFDGPLGFVASTPQMNESVLEAAICVNHRLPNVEGRFSDQVLQAAHTHFRRGLGLQELLSIAAERNSGYRGTARDVESLCRAAFRPRGHGGAYDLRADGSGPSTISVPGILSNVANKFLAAGFLYTEQAWRRIARIKPASDFKQMTTYRLTGANKFEKVAPGGEIRHGTLSELTYTNQVDTYGKMLGIDRRDIRNDDLGAFTGASDELGRGAGDSLNEVFWTAWLDDSTFFPTDKSKANYDDGATDSVLSLAGLDNANNIFASQTKPDGTPMGIMPAVLLVPTALWATAKNLMNGTVTASAQSTATVTLENIWKGMFEVVSSVYLQSSAITGYSATAWYLLADPNNVAAIEVAFLDGIETPTVETSDFDFDRLGISMRAYMDFGCSKMEYRAGVKLKGAA